MESGISWDFRDSQELIASSEYNKEGYIIQKADLHYLNFIKNDVEEAYFEFTETSEKKYNDLESAHYSIPKEESNDLRLHIMQKIYQNTNFHRNYYNTAKNIIHSLCGNELAMQKRPGLSINLPNNPDDILPIHADTWNGVSPFELNIWIPFVDCTNSMCLYILERDKYSERIKNQSGLLKLTSDELFKELKNDQRCKNSSKR